MYGRLVRNYTWFEYCYIVIITGARTIGRFYCRTVVKIQLLLWVRTIMHRRRPWSSIKS